MWLEWMVYSSWIFMFICLVGMDEFDSCIGLPIKSICLAQSIDLTWGQLGYKNGLPFRGGGGGRGSKNYVEGCCYHDIQPPHPPLTLPYQQQQLAIIPLSSPTINLKSVAAYHPLKPSLVKYFCVSHPNLPTIGMHQKAYETTCF